MREIKFRAYDRKNKQFVSVGQNFDVDNGFEAQIYLGAKFINGKEVEQDIVLMQYTGLHDKNGKEIYEGDIVTFKRRTNDINISPMVAFASKEAIYKGAVVWGRYGWKPWVYEGVDESSFEVIGNIYENPELLVKETK